MTPPFLPLTLGTLKQQANDDTSLTPTDTIHPETAIFATVSALTVRLQHAVQKPCSSTAIEHVEISVRQYTNNNGEQHLDCEHLAVPL